MNIAPIFLPLEEPSVISPHGFKERGFIKKRIMGQDFVRIQDVES
jgi:hypothetical protein